MKKIPVKIDDVVIAIEDNSELVWFLDSKTGDVFFIDSDSQYCIDQFIDETDKDVDEITDEDLEKWMKSSSLADWQHAPVRQLWGIDKDTDNRFIKIFPMSSRDSYRIMENFIDTVNDKHLNELLTFSIEGRGAFSRFKSVLNNYPDECDLWFTFKEKRMTAEAIEWLQNNGIEPVI